MDLFWAKVDKTEDCWLWTAATNKHGYGVLRHKGRNYLAHRFATELLTGAPPEGDLLDHKCHTPACVRPHPKHVVPATFRENMENRKGAQANSKSGVRGVLWYEPNGKWRVAVGRKHIGYYTELEDAEAAAVAARAKHFTNSQN